MATNPVPQGYTAEVPGSQFICIGGPPLSGSRCTPPVLFLYDVLVPWVLPKVMFLLYLLLRAPSSNQRFFGRCFFILPSLSSLGAQHFILLIHPHRAPCSSEVSTSPLYKLVALPPVSLSPGSMPIASSASVLLHHRSLKHKAGVFAPPEVFEQLPLAVKAVTHGPCLHLTASPS